MEQEPALVNAGQDWGSGDFETALGAAAHMGNKEIAIYLLDHGARLDIFAAVPKSSWWIERCGFILGMACKSCAACSPPSLARHVTPAAEREDKRLFNYRQRSRDEQ